jgi:hypothetical protein
LLGKLLLLCGFLISFGLCLLGFCILAVAHAARYRGRSTGNNSRTGRDTN